MIGNGTPKKKIATNAAAASAIMIRFLSDFRSDPHHRLEHDGEHGGLEAEEQGRDDADLAEQGVDDAERHDRDDAGQDEQHAGDHAAERAVHEPADVGGELLRLGAGQEHAVVQGMQEPVLADPALLLDDDAVHDRDLAGGSAEAEQRDARPDPERLAEADAVRGRLMAAVGGLCDG